MQKTQTNQNELFNGEKKKQNQLNKKQHKILQDVLADILLRDGFGYRQSFSDLVSDGMLHS